MFADLDKVLKTRCTPDMPGGLSARIVDAARSVDQHSPAKFPVFVQDFFEDIRSSFALPQPAYVVAGMIVFVIGLSLGMSADDSTLLSGLTVGELAAFMEINDSFVAGEWV